MPTSTQSNETIRLWSLITKEITGIQLLWETVNSLYFKKPKLNVLWQNTPLLYGLLQTTLMESMLIRISRLMDPAESGRNKNMQNLSLNQLEKTDGNLSTDVKLVRDIWDASNLKHMRDKYLSHNDLKQLLSNPHTLSIPLDTVDITAMEELTCKFREFRCKVNSILHNGEAYLDQSTSLQIEREINTLTNSLLGGKLFFEYLPEHEDLMLAWEKIF